MTSVLLLALALVAPQETPQEKPRAVPKDSIELVVIGCLSGRVIAIDDVRQTDVQSGPIIKARSFRLAGKRDVMDIVKQENHRIVEITGIVKKSSLVEPGMKVGKGITIGGGAPVAGSRPGAPPSPVEYVAVMDVESVQPRGTSCGGGL